LSGMAIRTWEQNIGTFFRGGKALSPPAAYETSNSEIFPLDANRIKFKKYTVLKRILWFQIDI